MAKIKNKRKYFILIIVIALILATINIVRPFSKAEDELMAGSLEETYYEEGQEITDSDVLEDNVIEDNTIEEDDELEATSVSEDDGIAAYAATSTFTSGDGTSASPYQISTKDDMFLLAELVNSHTQDPNGDYYNTKYYELTNDIDIENSEWTPIGVYNTTMSGGEYIFKGNFNGNGYTVKNITITVDAMPTYKSKYGLFAAIYSSDSSNRAMVCNLEVDNINIQVTASGNTTKDLAFGGIVGHIGKNSSVINCIVKNSSISIESGFTLTNSTLLAIGGIAGDSSQNSTESNSGYSEVSGEAMYKIENCFSDVDITVNDESWASGSTGNAYYQYNIGGIIGRIRAQAQLPQNCIYTGTISATKAFIGPIYGAARYNTGNSGNTYYMNTYLGANSSGNSIGTLENGYFCNYKIINGQEYDIGINYKTDLQEVTLGNLTGYTLSNLAYMEKVQGVNRGEYLAVLGDGINILNDYSGVGSTYNTWYYDYENKNYTFKEIEETLEVEINKNAIHNYTAQVLGDYDDEEFTYKWYIDGIEQIETTNTITLREGDPTLDRVLKVEVLLNGEVVGYKAIVVEAEVLELKISKKQEQGAEILYVEINSSFGLTIDDYTYEWYKQNSETLQFEKIGIFSECEVQAGNGDTFKVIATHKENASYSKEVIYQYGDAIYVNYSELILDDVLYPEGVDTNDGQTPQTAVKTLEAAYELLPSEAVAEDNIIVIMGVYDQTFSDMTFNKPTTIVGEFIGNQWNGTINLKESQSIVLKAETIFKNITFNGRNGERTVYCQGNSLTIDENCVVTNFSNASDSWGLRSTNYPAFCIVGGWLNYENTTKLPEETCNIIIKSGCYGRILAGGRSEGGSDIFGTQTNPFNVNITIDIPEDDPSLKTYDNSVGLLVGGQADGSCYINNIINVKNGTIGRLVGGNLGYGRRSNGIPEDIFFGSTLLNLSGGMINELFGGSYGRNSSTAYYFGKIQINITGTTIGDNLYGTGAGGVTGYPENSTYTYAESVRDQEMQDSDGNIFKLDETEVEINISDNAQINGNVYGGGYGYSIFLTEGQIASDGGCLYGNTTINLTGGVINGNVYGGGKGTNNYSTNKSHLARVEGNVTINVSGEPTVIGSIYGGSEGVEGYDGMGEITGDVAIYIKDVELGKVAVTDVYGGGKGSSAVIKGTTKVDIDNSIIYGNVYGGGDAGDVTDGTEVNIYGGSNITTTVYEGETRGGEVYGGGNQANVGTADNYNEGILANTKVIVYDANIGKISGTTITGGEVFGGGNYGIVYGNTEATIGSINETISTVIGSEFYAGGRGETGTTTVMGNSNAYILGMSTSLESYGDISLGEVQGDVNITFNTYRNRSATNKYENMKGINKATNMYLVESYIYLTEGLKDITNLYVPSNSGIMISENSEILGNFVGGGYLYLQNEVCLTIDGDMYDSDSSETKTILTLNPALVDNTYYVIKGNSYSPYIRVLGNDYSSGLGVESGDRMKYDIYSLNKDDSIAQRYNCTAPLENFEATEENDENGTIYKNLKNENDTRNYYYDGNTMYIIADDLELVEIGGVASLSNTEEEIDTIYYIDTTIIIPSYATVENYSAEDKLYYSQSTNTNNINIQPYDSFTSCINIVYTMAKNNDGEYMNPDEFENVTRSICLESDGEIYKFPINTTIIMVANGIYYTYRVESDASQIYLTDFEDEAGQKYVELNDVKSILTQTNPLIPALWETSEQYRFIIDFSECNNSLEEGIYDMTFKIEDTKENSEDNEVYTDVRTNSIQIESRNYNANLTSDKAIYVSNETIKIAGKLNLDRLSIEISSDLGKDVVARINLKDSNGNIIEFPEGVVIKVNGTQYEISDNIMVKIIQNLEQKSYSKNIEFLFDRSSVAGNNILPNGEYEIEFTFYLSENDILLGRKAVLTTGVTFSIERAENYGIRITSVDKTSGQRNDEVQIITEENAVTKTVNIEYQNGNLQDGTYIVAKTYKRQKDGSFTYIDLGATIVENQKVTVNGNQTVKSNVVFGTTLQNGTYKIVYELTNKDGNVITSTHINFIVNR